MTKDELSETRAAARTRNSESRAAYTEAKVELLHEQSETLRAARKALEKVFNDPVSTPEQVLEAAALLVKLGTY